MREKWEFYANDFWQNVFTSNIHRKKMRRPRLFVPGKCIDLMTFRGPKFYFILFFKRVYGELLVKTIKYVTFRYRMPPKNCVFLKMSNIMPAIGFYLSPQSKTTRIRGNRGKETIFLEYIHFDTKYLYILFFQSILK